MFKAIGELFALLTLSISALSDLAFAGKAQTAIIRDSSEFDAQKKRAKLTKDLADYEAQLASETPISAAKLKAA